MTLPHRILAEPDMMVDRINADEEDREYVYEEMESAIRQLCKEAMGK